MTKAIPEPLAPRRPQDDDDEVWLRTRPRDIAADRWRRYEAAGAEIFEAMGMAMGTPSSPPLTYGRGRRSP